MEFEVQTNYTIEDFAAYWRGFRWKSPGKRPPKAASRRAQKAAGWVLVLAGGLFLALALWMRPRAGRWMVCMGALYLGVGLLAVLRRAPDYPRWVQRAWRTYQKQGERCTYRFTEQDFELCATTSSHRYSYIHLQQLWEDEGHFYLFLGPQSPHMLNKADFTCGDPAAFAAFLAAKAGKPVRPVNGEPR